MKFKGTLDRVYNKQEIIIALRDYLDVALIKDIQGVPKLLRPDKTFVENKEFWIESVQNNLVPGQIVKLQNFKILEWIPSSPGLYFTNHAEQQRIAAFESYQRWAKGYEIDDSRFSKSQKELDEEVKLRNKIIELRPNEKMGMVQGGYGCLRVSPKRIYNEIQYISCASSNGIGHEGIPILLKEEHYKKVVLELRNGKVPVVDLLGRLMILPTELSPIKVKYHKDVPKFYLEIEELKVKKHTPTANALVSVAITYARKNNYFDDLAFSYSFCSFTPTKNNNDLKEATAWLLDYAQRYSEDKNPVIVGDFDEEFKHFENVEFPISDIVKGHISIEKLIEFGKSIHINIQVNELFMGDKNEFINSQIG